MMDLGEEDPAIVENIDQCGLNGVDLSQEVVKGIGQAAAWELHSFQLALDEVIESSTLSLDDSIVLWNKGAIDSNAPDFEGGGTLLGSRMRR